MGAEGNGHRRWQYSPTVTLGNLLTILMIGAGCAGVYATSVARLAVIEERTQQIPELRRSIDDVRSKIEGVGERVGILWDRKEEMTRKYPASNAIP